MLDPIFEDYLRRIWASDVTEAILWLLAACLLLAIALARRNTASRFTRVRFTDYLEKKASFVRSGRLSRAYGEENLVAYYAIRINDRGEAEQADWTEEERDPIPAVRSFVWIPRTGHMTSVRAAASTPRSALLPPVS